jgi:DNA-binding XRE family transcriptional regulator
MSTALQSELESARRAAGVSQQELASRAGLSRMTVQRTESHEIDPRLSTVIEMARALGMDVMLVPTVLRPDLENFVRAGKYLAQPPGGDAPPSVVDTLIAK